MVWSYHSSSIKDPQIWWHYLALRTKVGTSGCIHLFYHCKLYSFYTFTSFFIQLSRWFNSFVHLIIHPLLLQSFIPVFIHSWMLSATTYLLAYYYVLNSNDSTEIASLQHILITRLTKTVENETLRHYSITNCIVKVRRRSLYWMSALKG